MAAFLVAAGAGLFVALPPKRFALTPSTGAAVPSVVAGVSHVHTSRSDGTGTPDEVAAAAARAGLQFMVFTDHGDGTRQPDPPQYRHGVLCLDAVEISTIGGHYIAVGLPKAPYPLGGEARDVIEDVKRLGGFGIVAHPDSAKNELRWREWTAPFDAMEWLNGDSEWRDETPGRLMRALATYPFRPAETLASLLDRPATTLLRWDRLTARRPVVGMPGSDAHARLGLRDEVDAPYRSRILLRLPSYETLFSTFSMRVELDRGLSGDAAVDSASLLGALRAGRLYTVVEALAVGARFEFGVRGGTRRARQGSSLEPDGPLVVEIRSNAPSGSSIALFRDGRLLVDQPGPELRRELPSLRGVLRAEVRLGRGGQAPVPWIVSNPVYVSPPPLPLPPHTSAKATESRRLDEVDAERPWRIELQAGSTGTLEREGESGRSVRYALRPDTTAQSVALVRPDDPVIRQFTRVSFRGSADNPMRLSVQLRQPGGTEGQRWRRSVYLDETPREITVLFGDMSPVGLTDTFNPDMHRVQDLLFVVDTTNTAPGTSGRFSIENVRLER